MFNKQQTKTTNKHHWQSVDNNRPYLPTCKILISLLQRLQGKCVTNIQTNKQTNKRSKIKSPFGFHQEQTK